MARDLPTNTTAMPASSAAPGQTGADGFRPVEGGNEVQSGERLMVEAYAAIWIIVFMFVLFSWRRQKAIDARVGELEVLLAKAKEGR